ncbi:MAG: MFS transporter [Caldilineaceae bacterium]|nr:MFS transporter [Caldilineaceae bacterium]
MKINTSAQPLPPARLIWLITFSGFFSFFVFGFIDNLKGPTLPSVLRDMAFGYGQGGTILFGAYLGFVIATLLTGPLSDWMGNRTVLMLAGALIFVGILGFSTMDTFALLFATMLVIGLGMGSIEVGGNALIVDVHRHEQGRYLNLLATFHGVGSLIVPLYAAWLLETGVSWRQVFQWTLPLAGAMFLVFLLLPAPPAKHESSGGFDWSAVRSRGFSGPMIGYYVAIALYVSAEFGIGAWLVEFLIQAKGMALTTASLLLSGFFGMLMLGRIVGSFVVERVGYLRSILLAAVGGLICLVIGVFGPPALAIFVPLTGLFFSIIFPTITAAVSALHTKNTGTMLGLLFAAGGLGGALGPWSIGVAGDIVGIELGFALTAVFCAGVIVMLAMLMGKMRGA